MKTIKILGFLLLLGTSSLAQDLSCAEYFFNTDPGIGEGTPFNFTASQSIAETFDIPTTGLSPGFHNLFIRFSDANGLWGIAEGRTVYIQPTPEQDPAPTLSACEYFFNTDPGPGNAIAINILPQVKMPLSAGITTTGLEPGFHNLFIRFKDDKGIWGIAEGRTVYIQPAPEQSLTAVLDAYEYFFNTDPGIGQGTAISMQAGGKESTQAQINTSGLEPGFHTLFVRYRTEEGVWGLYEGRTFYIQPQLDDSTPPMITRAEYFFDTDPGKGLGNPIPVDEANEQKISPVIPLNGLQEGFHQVFIRLMDEHGRWGHSEGRTLYIAYHHEIPKIPLLSNAEYFFNTDLGQGKGIPFDFDDSTAVSFTQNIPLQDLPVGDHEIFIRFRNDLGVWSWVQSGSFTLTSTVNTETLRPDFLRVYPNPGSNVVKIEAKLIKQVTIYNHVGQIVLDQQYEEADLVEINTDSFDEGIYIVKVKAGEERTTVRLAIVN